jgi:hypothetical protein
LQEYSLESYKLKQLHLHKKSPTKWGRLRNFGDLDRFVGARRMEDLLNFLIESWEVQTYIPRYMPDTHAHDPEGIG